MAFTPRSGAGIPQHQTTTPVRAFELQLPAPKRIKLEPTLTDNSVKRHNAVGFRLDQLSAMRTAWDDLITELYFLEEGGNLTDMNEWRRRPSLQLAAYKKRLRLEDTDQPEPESRPPPTPQSAPAALEYKFVPLTPSSKAAAAASLVTVFRQKSASVGGGGGATRSSYSPAVVPPSQQQTTTAASVSSTAVRLEQSSVGSPSSDSSRLEPVSSKLQDQDGTMDRAKREAHALRRVLELRKQGLWSERRLPRVAEPRRRKGHWDYLMDEMQWMAMDFEQERKWKKAAALKCVRMVEKHFQEKSRQAEKAAKREQNRLRSIASFVAFEMRRFWDRVQGVVDVKASLSGEYRLRGVYRETIDAEEAAARSSDGLSEQLRLLRAESTMPLSELVESLPAAYIQDRLAAGSNSAQTRGDSSDDDAASVADEVGAEPAVSDDVAEGVDGSDDEQRAGSPGGGALVSDPEHGDAHLADVGADQSDFEADIEDERRVYSLLDCVCANAVLEDVDCAVTADGDSESSVPSSDDLKELASVAQSLQPAGSQLSSCPVDTPSPFLLKQPLREYQHIGLHWLVGMRQRRLNAVLADEYGLGKTIQVIALIAHLAGMKADWGPHLVVTSTCNLLSWEAEFRKWCPAMKLLVYCGSAEERRVKRSMFWTKSNAFHVCIVSYRVLRADQTAFCRKWWQLAVLDDAHRLLAADRRWLFVAGLRCRQRLMLTAGTLGRDVRQLWSLTTLLIPGLAEAAPDWLQAADEQRGARLHGRLLKLLRCFSLLRRVDQLVVQLPGVQDNVILCPLQERQRRLYDAAAAGDAVQEALADGSFHGVMHAVLQLRRVCNHPDLVAPRLVVSPFCPGDGIVMHTACCVPAALSYDSARHISLATLNLLPAGCERSLSAFQASRTCCLQPSRSQLEEPHPAPVCPAGLVRLLLPDVTGNGGGRLRSEMTAGPLLALLMGRVVSPAGGAAGQTLSRMASMTVPATVPQSRPLPSAPSPALVNSTDRRSVEPAAQSPPPTPPPSPGPQPSHLVPSGRDWLQSLYRINRSRCEAAPLFGTDVVETLTVSAALCRTSWNSVASAANIGSKRNRRRRQQLRRVSSVLDPSSCVVNDLFMYVPAAVCARPPCLRVCHAASFHCRSERTRRAQLSQQLSAVSSAGTLHCVATARMFRFPEPRLLLRDCGKLQVLVQLLHQLRCSGRRVLLLAQMARMLDILERFLDMSGFAYLRVDGRTRVHCRHAAIERFNGDARLLCLLMSTRAGRDGMNVTGADTVIFYDADWSPTMDAQAQSRCHRIGHTRDVHIYRLVSEGTIEENIVKHVDETRLVRDVIVQCDGGRSDDATRWRLQRSTLADLFGASTVAAATLRADERGRIPVPAEGERRCGTTAVVFEDALTAVEDAGDARALRTARASQSAEASEFDDPESCPSLPSDFLEDRTELDELEDELSDLERWAVFNLEQPGGASLPEFDALSASARRRKNSRQELNTSGHLVLGHGEEGGLGSSLEMITYPSQETSEIWISSDSERARLPMWCPPTPPRDDDLDAYVDPTFNMLYSEAYMTESQLPSVYIKKEVKKPPALPASPNPLTVAVTCPSAGAVDVTPSVPNLPPPSTSTVNNTGGNIIRKPLKVRREEAGSVAPRSLFNRVPSSVLRMRRELHLQQRRTLFSPGGATFGGLTLSKAGGSPVLGAKASALLEHGSAEWMLHEDWLLLQALRSVLEMPLSLLALSPAHVVNWELICELVNQTARAYRSSKFCRMRYDSVVQPREEGKVVFSSPHKKSKKHKQLPGTPGGGMPMPKATRPVRTSQLMLHDKNQNFNQLVQQRFDTMKGISNKRAPTTRPPLNTLASQRNPKHTAVLGDSGVEYDSPQTPAQVANSRIARLAKEKQKAAATAEQLSRLQKVQATAGGTLVTGATTTRLQTTPGGRLGSVSVAGSVAGPAAIVSVASLTPAQVQVAQRLVSASAAGKPTTIQALTQKSLTPAQLQALKQQTVLRHKLALASATGAAGLVGGQKVQVEVSALGGVVPTVSAGGAFGQSPSTSRTQVRILKQPVGKHMVAARTMTESEMAVILKQRPQLAQTVQSALVPQLLAQVQSAAAAASAPTSVTISLPRTAAGITCSKPGGALTAAGRPILAQSVRKLATTSAATGGGAKRLPAQLSTVQLVQAGAVQKQQLPGTVTVQQLVQPVMGRVQSPASGARLVSSSPRQTIQVVSAATAAAIRQPSTAVQLVQQGGVSVATGVTLSQLRPLLCTTVTSGAAVGSVSRLTPQLQQTAVLARGSPVTTRVRTTAIVPPPTAQQPQIITHQPQIITQQPQIITQQPQIITQQQTQLPTSSTDTASDS